MKHLRRMGGRNQSKKEMMLSVPKLKWFRGFGSKNWLCSVETITTSIVGYTPIQNKKVFFKNDTKVYKRELKTNCTGQCFKQQKTDCKSKENPLS